MLSIIAAVSENNALGKDNKLLWHLPADLKRLKTLTMGHHLIMGRKTWESLGRPLPGRPHVVISRNKDLKHEAITVVSSLDEAIEISKHVDFLLLDSGNPKLAIKELGGTGRVTQLGRLGAMDLPDEATLA